MPYYSDEALVLKRHNLGESDRIITLLTKYHGKISAVAKGVRKVTSRKSGHLELFNQIDAKFAQGKSLDIITEVNPLQTFSELKKDLQTIGQGFYVSELANTLLPEGKRVTEVFHLVQASLEFLNLRPNDLATEEHMKEFEIRFLKLAGFWSDEMFKRKKPQTLDEWRRFNRIFIEHIIDRRLRSPAFLKQAH